MSQKAPFSSGPSCHVKRGHKNRDTDAGFYCTTHWLRLKETCPFSPPSFGCLNDPRRGRQPLISLTPFLLSLIHSTPVPLTSLLLPKHASGPLHWPFPLPGMPFAAPARSLPSLIFVHVTFSKRHTLTTHCP